MIAKEQMFEVYANYDFFGGGVLVNVWGGAHPPAPPRPENSPLLILLLGSKSNFLGNLSNIVVLNSIILEKIIIMNNLLQVDYTYNGALDTELAQAMYDCDADVSHLNNVVVNQVFVPSLIAIVFKPFLF